MANITNSYETIMVFNVGQGEESIKALYERFKSIIAENGAITEEEDWGKRRLAYPIEDELEGYYYLVRFTAGRDFPAELDRVYKITDGVLRTLIIRLDPEDEKKRAAKSAPAVAAAPAAAETSVTAEPVAAPEPAESAQPETQAVDVQADAAAQSDADTAVPAEEPAE